MPQVARAHGQVHQRGRPGSTPRSAPWQGAVNVNISARQFFSRRIAASNVCTQWKLT
jgi:hypothetical protein